jgi:inositol-hexakisphosphate kinase
MCTFGLCRYIGVLNVTFSKGPKPSKDTSGDAHKIPEDSKVSQSESKGAVTVDKKLNIPNEKKDPPRVAENQQRIVSHSQQIGEMPQVILEQNRHIVPFSLFDFAKRPRTTEPQDSNDHRPFKPDDPREPDRDPHQLVTPTAERPSPARPLLPNQPSWGKTSVNSKFGEQIWRDAFTPPPIHHYKKHAKGHTTLPRVREPSIRRRGNLSADPIGQNRRTASIPADEQRIPAQAEEVDSSKTDNKTLATPSNIMPQDTYSMSASAFEDLSHVLEKVKTTNSISSEGSQVSRSSNKIRRRHSGMGLRRRGNSVHDRSRGNLEYYDEEGYGGDGEDEVFRMESDRGSYTAISAEPSSTIAQDLENAAILTTVHNDAQEVKAHGDVESALHETSTSGSAKQPVPDRESSLNHLPLNPKEAQLAKPDERVVFFLLLEDLTADMGRPCVLDLKMGTRQYGIEANPKKMESQRRKCKTTTSQQLGVRICGMQTFNVKKQQPAYEDKYFGRDLKAGREFREALIRFLYDGVSYSSVAKRIPTILDKISKLESMVRRLPGYRFYASSLLMLYDAEPGKSQRAKDEAAKGKGPGEKNDEEKEKDKDKDKKWLPPIELKIVDFANCVTGEDPLPPNATCPPFHPGAVDRGYLRGLRTLKMYFQRILRDITESEFIERGDGEATGVDLVGAGGTHGGSEIGLEEDEGEVSI